uniref:P2X purinoceptor 6 isoform X2 n=1 Tax=Podarcis muralis TaxID=64176 RepID=UPI00109FF0AB|nr:P2X purinoceptor 6 isoform X2 [Podarcis muralis]
METTATSLLTLLSNFSRPLAGQLYFTLPSLLLWKMLTQILTSSAFSEKLPLCLLFSTWAAGQEDVASSVSFCCRDFTASRPAMGDSWSHSCFGFLDYKTEKFALTRNRKVGVLHRLIQLGIVGYILGWVFLAKKGYQEKDTDPHISVITKLKGISVTRVRELGDRIWDVADYVKPPQGENVFFVVTNFIATPKQVQGSCPEHPSIPDGNCRKDEDCSPGQPVVHGNGVKTGKCVPFGASHNTCEIYGWCPVENKTLSRTNTLKTTDGSYFKGCRYDAVDDPYCPVFRIRDMVEAAGESFEEMAHLGGAIGLRIDWDCDLDQPPSRCRPCYSFTLLEKKFNFRTASYYRDPLNRQSRSLLKLYGIRFDISVHGQAGKFSIIPTAVNLGTGAAFLGAAAMVCDLVLLYLDTKAEFYRSEKYEEAKPPKTKVDAAT